MIHWWRDEATITRFVCDLVAAEMSVLRPTGVVAPSAGWDATLHLSHDLGLDSLERVALASALNEAIHLHEAGIEDRLLICHTIGEWVAIAQDGLEVFSATLTFRTSGSSGAPKRCEHALSHLWQEVETLAPLFAGRRRVLSAVRGHHIYGFLFTILLPSKLALQGRDLVDLRHRAPTSVVAELRAGDLVVGYPDFWRAVARTGITIPSGITGITSTGPCPPEVARDLAALGLDTLVELYGSSETAGVGLRSSAADPYSLMSFWQRADGDANTLVRVAPNGTTTIYQLQDKLEWVDERRFRPAGRLDEALQVAGVNVFPANVRRVLMEHPDVRDAAVRRMSDDPLSRLKAFVVPREGRTGDASLHAELEAWVTSRLSTPERPKAFTFGDAIPVQAGKGTDWSSLT